MGNDVEARIIGLLETRPEWGLEQLVASCPEFTWNQLFLAVDSLSRTGAVRLRAKGVGIYLISAVCPAAQVA